MCPVEVVALPYIQLLHFLDEDAKACWVAELHNHTSRLGILVRRTVDCLSGAIDIVSRRFATTKW